MPCYIAGAVFDLGWNEKIGPLSQYSVRNGYPLSLICLLLTIYSTMSYIVLPCLVYVQSLAFAWLFSSVTLASVQNEKKSKVKGMPRLHSHLPSTICTRRRCSPSPQVKHVAPEWTLLLASRQVNARPLLS